MAETQKPAQPRTLDPNKVQICRVAPIDYDNGQPCACPEGSCNLWKGGLKPASEVEAARAPDTRSERERFEALYGKRGETQLPMSSWDAFFDVWQARASPDTRSEREKFDAPYLDGLIDRLLMPLPAQTQADVDRMHREAAEMIHRQAKQIRDAIKAARQALEKP